MSDVDEIYLPYVTAYGALHEVVRAHLEGERNVKYLRRQHAEIEQDLRAAIKKERGGG